MVESMTDKFLKFDVVEGISIQPLESCETGSSDIVPLSVGYDCISLEPIVNMSQKVSEILPEHEIMHNDNNTEEPVVDPIV